MSDTFSSPDGIDLIIPFRNEREHLPALLKSLDHLEYQPEDECFLVDDLSEDGGAEFIHQTDFIHLLQPVGDEAGSKKKALTAGIGAGKNPLILTTDADCIFSAGWLETMRNLFDQDVDMLIGPVMVHRGKGFPGMLQHVEGLVLLFVTRSAVRMGRPLLCSGANLLFSREGFVAAGGYASHLHRSSGDDVLLMRSFLERNRNAVRFADAPQACIYTQPVKTWRSWFDQRLRWISKAGHVGGLALYFSLFLIMELFLPLILLYPIWLISLLIVLTEYLILYKTISRYNASVSFWDWLIFRFLYPMYCLLLSIMALFRRPVWKDRKVI